MDYSELLSYNLSMPVIVLLAVTLLCMVLFLCIWVPYVGRPGRKVGEENEKLEIEAGNVRPVDEVSVIVYANNDGENIEQLLNSILSQKAVETMEVIVVNDGIFDSTHDIVGRLELQHSNLYMTYAPENSRNLSRRKLALTLGIKAARYEKLVFTTGKVMIQSDFWLNHMASPLDGGYDIVLGYAYPDANGRDNGAKRLRAFDTVWEAVSWLSPAISGNVTRGIGANLAYRRQLFFDNKGFSRSLNLVNGDDDIFISEIASGRNATVEIASEMQVGVDDWNPAATHGANKLGRRFTGLRISRWPRLLMAAGAWLMWAILGCGIAAGVLGWPSLLPAAASLCMLLGASVPAMFAWRRTSVGLHSRRLFFTVVPLLLWHPFYNLAYAIRSRLSRRKNFTWSELDK